MDALVNWYSESSLATCLDPMIAPLSFFAVLLLVTLIVRGWKAWTLRASLGVLATLVLVVFNVLVGPWVEIPQLLFEELYQLALLPQVPQSFWKDQPLWVPVVTAIVVTDFADYWNHRLMRSKWVWPIHAVHHSDPDVNPLTTFRIHELEGILMAVSYVVLLNWLNLPGVALGAFGLTLSLHNMYIHADLDWSHGPLRMLIASPRYHRWHHADVPEAHGKNLANLIPLYDWAFGTYYCPGPCEAPLGAAGVPQHNPFALMVFPFVLWSRYLREGVSRARSSGPFPSQGNADD